MAQLIEQPRVFDRNNPLVSESSDQLNLFFGEWFHLSSGEYKDANRGPLTQERHAEHCSVPEYLLIPENRVF